MTDSISKEDAQFLLNKLNEGRAILTAGRIHENVPTIHDVGTGDRQTIKTDTPVDHAGYGLFIAKKNGETITFDGGGAMSRLETVSFTILRPTDLAKEMGYNFDIVRAALEELSK